MKKIELVKSPVVFNEEEHTYFLGDKQLQGITSTLIHRAFPDKYKNVDSETLANAARKGKDFHALIEYHDTFGTDASEHQDPRIESYERLKAERGLTTIANEYLVSDEENYATCIDIVVADINGDIGLVDVKTTWTLDKMSTGLQLSINKKFFERQNPGLKVKFLFAIWLPNKDHSLSELCCLPPFSEDVVDRLIEADKHDEPFDISIAFGTLPAKVKEVEDEIVKIEHQVSEMKARQDLLKKGLYNLMEENNVKSFRGEKILLTRVLPTSAETFDSKRFKEDFPEMYQRYVKLSKRSGSLKITVLKNKE